MRIVFKVISVWAGIGLMVPVAHARVFNFNQPGLAGYFRGTGGMQAAGDQAFADSSGSLTTSFNREVEYNFSGELGFVWASDKISARVGLEAIQTRDLETTGKNAGGAALMTVSGRAIAFNPNLTFEYNIINTGTFKVLGFAGAGYSTVKVSNTYVLTAAGQAAYPGVADYKETVSGFAISSHLGVGTEMFLFDNVTLLTEVGYRYLDVTSLKYQDDLTTVNGAVTKGSRARNNNGKTRSFDFSSPFIGVSFRFYIPQFM